MHRRDALRLVFGLPALLWLQQAAALDLNAQARVDRSLILGDIDIAAFLDVPAEISEAWAVLTDYNRLAEFVPDMDTSRIVSKPGEPTRVYQRGEKKWLLIGMPLELLFRMEELPPSRIRFRLLSGNINQMFGEWQLLKRGNLTRITYRAHMKPGLLSLRAPGDHLLIEADIIDMLNAIGREILKRKAATPRARTLLENDPAA